MKYKIITDSSSNLSKDFLKNEKDIGFAIAPLTMMIDGKEYVDDENMTSDEILDALNNSKEKATSSCPSPAAFLDLLQGADYYIIITISSKLSGSFNSASVARMMFSKPENVIVIDSLLVCGAMQILVNKAVEFIHEDVNFSDMESKLLDERDKNNLLFVLDKFDNFIKNGRISKFVAFIATALKIKPLCYGKDGQIDIKEKIRTLKGVLKRLVYNIGIMCPETKGRICIISQTKALDSANILKEEIIKTYQFDNVIIEENRGLCSFYSLEGGLIVSF
jgi:DegV family protein with EDD domain